MALGIAAFIAEGFPGQAPGLLFLIALYLVFSLPVALPAVVAFLLLMIAFRRLGWDDWWRFGLGGTVIGWLSVLTLAAVFDSPSLTASNGFEIVGILYTKDALLMALSGAGDAHEHLRGTRAPAWRWASPPSLRRAFRVRRQVCSS